MDLTFIKVVLLAVVQGIAEFLPISSSGHVTMLGDLVQLSGDDTALVDAVVHGGTLAAVVLFYFTVLWRIVFQSGRRRVIWLVILASIPAGVVGMPLKLLNFEDYMNNLWVVGIGFLITSYVLRRFGAPAIPAGQTGAVLLDQLPAKKAFAIGLAQMAAIPPGISRSGSTICAGLRAGLGSKDAAEFSFLMAAVITGGPLVLELPKIAKLAANPAGDASDLTVWMLATAFVLAAAVGYFSLAVLIKVLNRGKLAAFSPYLFAVGFFTLGMAVYKCARPLLDGAK